MTTRNDPPVSGEKCGKCGQPEGEHCYSWYHRRLVDGVGVGTSTLFACGKQHHDFAAALPSTEMPEGEEQARPATDADWQEWLAKNRRFDDPADVVCDITGTRADVWIFSGVKVGSFDDADEANALRDLLNKNAHQWFAAQPIPQPNPLPPGSWVSTEDDLPLPDQWVLVATRGGDIGMMKDSDESVWDTDGGPDDITHWMPVPDHPQDTRSIPAPAVEQGEGERQCPACGVERTDYEGAGKHLPTCPNCGSGWNPIPTPPSATEAERLNRIDRAHEEWWEREVADHIKTPHMFGLTRAAWHAARYGRGTEGVGDLAEVIAGESTVALRELGIASGREVATKQAILVVARHFLDRHAKGSR